MAAARVPCVVGKVIELPWAQGRNGHLTLSDRQFELLQTRLEAHPDYQAIERGRSMVPRYTIEFAGANTDEHYLAFVQECAKGLRWS